jgi:hypothetical protein
MILPRRTFLTRLTSLVAFPLVVPAHAIQSILANRSQIILPELSKIYISRDNRLSFANYMHSPVVLWRHRYDIDPIARVTAMSGSFSDGDQALTADIEFPPQGTNPQSDVAYAALARNYAGTSFGYTKPNNELLELSVIARNKTVGEQTVKTIGQRMFRVTFDATIEDEPTA